MAKGSTTQAESVPAPVVEQRKGTLHTQNPEVRMFQILKDAVGKVSGNAVCFASEPFKGGGWKADDTVGKIMADVGKGITAIVGQRSIVYYNARNPRQDNGAFQKAG